MQVSNELSLMYERILSLFIATSEIYSSCKYIIKLELVNYKNKAESRYRALKPKGPKLENKVHLFEMKY